MNPRQINELQSWCIERRHTLKRQGLSDADAWQKVGDGLAFMHAEGMLLFSRESIEAVEAWWSQPERQPKHKR